MPTRGESGLPLGMRRLLPASVLFVVTVVALRPVNDPDTFWHLATGDWLRGVWQFSGPDPWSPMSTRTWTLHEWLPELALSVVHQFFGLVGVAWLLPLGVAGVTVAVLFACRERASLLVSAFILILAIVAMSGSLSLRPQLVTFALTAVTITAWNRSSNDGRPRWWLIPMTWLWACSHGMWFIGILIGVVTLAGLLLDRTWDRRRWTRLAMVPLASGIAAALTPAGPGLLLAPLEVGAYTKYVSEWAPPSLADFQFVVLLLLGAMPIVVWLRQGERVSWASVLTLGLGVGLGLMYARTISLSAVVIAPMAAAAVQQLVPQGIEPRAKTEWGIQFVSTIAALALAAGLAPSRAATPGRVPLALNTYLNAIPAGTVVCNEYVLGGWIIWAHPNLRPTIDGRTEIYSVSHVAAYVDFVRAAPGWESYVQRARCTYALLPEDAPVVEALTQRSAWSVVSTDSGRSLLRAP